MSNQDGVEMHLSDPTNHAQAVSRCVAEQGRVVRLPLHILDGVKRIREVRRQPGQGARRGARQRRGGRPRAGHPRLQGCLL